ncbi:DUF1599 domain-containing protein [bacterium]|nr:DUF1599 domain-containing protein [bacterium]
MSSKTEAQYDRCIAKCREVFINKNEDYGPSWRILRVSSLIDQLYIKAKRIRTIEEKKVNKVGDAIESEFMGLVNYCAMTLIQIETGPVSLNSNNNEDFKWLTELFDKQLLKARTLMLAKNHDYGEVWRDMWVSSYTDLIITKLLRIRQIIENDGKTKVSEGIDSNILDIINYSVFALIKFDEQNENNN